MLLSILRFCKKYSEQTVNFCHRNSIPRVLSVFSMTKPLQRLWRIVGEVWLEVGGHMLEVGGRIWLLDLGGEGARTQ